MRTKVVHWILIFLLISLCINAFRTVQQFVRRGDIIQKTEERLQILRRKHDNLERKHAQTQTPAFIEQQAREKLRVSKEGEVVVLLPTRPVPTATPTPVNTANWDLWKDVFF